VKNALVGVNDRQGASGRIAGGPGRAIHHWQVEVRRRRSGRIEDFTASGPDDHLGLVLPRGRFHSLDLGQGTLAAERVERLGNPGLVKSALQVGSKWRRAERLATSSAGPRSPRPTISPPSEAVAFLPWV
jgi:hypothetical protein